jgi:hypothetical protein
VGDTDRIWWVSDGSESEVRAIAWTEAPALPHRPAVVGGMVRPVERGRGEALSVLTTIRQRQRTLVVAVVVAAVVVPAAPAMATTTGFKGVAGSRGWVEVTGDGRADLCRLDSNAPQCFPNLGGRLGTPHRLPGADAGYEAGRAWVDQNNDGQADYCRVVGGTNKMVQCSRNLGFSWGQTVTSGLVDAGYDAGRGWADMNGDGRADYCRVVGLWDKRLQCTVSTAAGFGTTFTSAPVDPGYDQGRTWVDVNGDNRADYCRIVGLGTKLVQCTLGTTDGFGDTITSGAVDPGWDDTRRFADVDGDNAADYCRVVNSSPNAKVLCTLAIGTAAESTIRTGPLDPGWGGTNAYADVDGDGREDFCRITDEHFGRCTLAVAGGFGITISTPAEPYRFDFWVDFDGDGRADLCQIPMGVRGVCRVSTGSGFGPPVVMPL